MSMNDLLNIASDLWEKQEFQWAFGGTGAALLAVLLTWLLTPKKHPTDEAFKALSRQLDEKDRQLKDLSRKLDDALQGERGERAALKEAVSAIPKQTGLPNAKARIKEALKAAAKGDTALAEDIFSEVEARKTGEGKAADREAAEAARHLGALAFLHDTNKALAAYRRATELDPGSAAGWNRLGLLLYRIGELDAAASAYRRVEAIGEAENDREALAVAYTHLGNIHLARGELERAGAVYEKALAIDEELGNKEGVANDYNGLGLVYYTRGDLERAEVMFNKALAIFEALGHKEGMAGVYGNLGNLYETRGELEQAEAMYKQALAIDEELGRKEGMADNYTNLGVLYKTRGDPDRAEALYRQALELFQAVGAKPKVEHVQRLLEGLRQ